MKTILVTALRLTALSVIVAGFVGISGILIVSTKGVSMQPAFSEGDLAILHRTKQYSVGDVAVYRSLNMDTSVMHRIVASDSGRYTFKGDNNTWLDPERPTRDQLLGKLALRIPNGGKLLARAVSPATVGGLVFSVLVSGGTALTMTKRGRRAQRRITGHPAAARMPSLRALPPPLRNAVSGVALLGLASALLGVVAWSRPISSTALTSSPATVTFSYRAAVAQSPAYDQTIVRNPQPVFRALTDVVDIAFVYDSGNPVDHSTVGVTVELATANGWRSSVPLLPTRRIARFPLRETIRLDLSQLQRRAEAAAGVIGSGPTGDVSVSVVPTITPGEGAAFRPALAFTLDSTALRLTEGTPANLRIDASSPDDTTTGSQAGTMAIPGLGRSLPVAYARTASSAGAAAALIAAGIVALLARRSATTSEADALTARHPGRLVPAEPIELHTDRPVVDLPNTDALLQVAGRYGLLVMHWDRGGTHTYVVLDDHTTYRCRTSASVPRNGRTAPAVPTHLVPAAPRFDLPLLQKSA